MSTHHDPRPRFRGVLFALLLGSGLALTGCSSDDDKPSPTGPRVSEFDEFMAVGQAQFAAPLAIAMLENVASFAQGVAGKDDGYSFVYDGESQRWITTIDYDQEGYAFTYFYAVQYRNADGQPQQSAASAASMHYLEEGQSNFSFSDDDFALVMSHSFASEATAGGLQTGNLLIDGGGSYELDYDMTADGEQESFDFTFGWETLGGGVQFPLSGCPNGTLRFFFPPYTLDLAFDGSSTVIVTMRDGNGNLVPEGSGSEFIGCSD
jgi:hypothetical protein